jgi:hypothetical protein
LTIRSFTSPRTFAERAWDKGKVRRPSEFIPNGCGSAAVAALGISLVPDELLGVEFGDECCNPHDAAYYRGGFLGLFWRKPRADVGLGACLARRMLWAARWDWGEGTARGKILATARALTAIPAGLIYTLAVLALGWTPFTWRWAKRELPPNLNAILG